MNSLENIASQSIAIPKEIFFYVLEIFGGGPVIY
jgi:hypothetical protein